jgi:hypothetical protein
MTITAHRISENTLAAIDFELAWKSGDAVHRDRLAYQQVNFWRDVLPGNPLVTARPLPMRRESWSPNTMTASYARSSGAISMHGTRPDIASRPSVDGSFLSGS